MKIDGPDFICIGARKTGTTWIYHYLKAHPDCQMPKIKEINFFNSVLFKANPAPEALAKKWAEARRQLKLAPDAPMPESWPADTFKWYAQLFRRRPGMVSGDVSPLYQTVPEGKVAALTKHLSQTRVLYVLRHPLERITSDFSMLANNRNIDTASMSDADLVKLIWEHYADSACYATIYQRWRTHFPVTVLFYDDLRADAAGFAHRLCEILGIRPLPELAAKTENPNPSKSYGPRPKLSPEVVRELAARLLPEAEAINALFDNKHTKGWLADLRERSATPV
jgi:hypothetical protein